LCAILLTINHKTQGRANFIISAHSKGALHESVSVMNSPIEIYRGCKESRAAVIARAVDMATRQGRPVIICASAMTPPVMINPGDTPGQAAQRMAQMERQGVLVAIAVWGAMILFTIALALWALSAIT
jgi:hypothetical protein